MRSLEIEQYKNIKKKERKNSIFFNKKRQLIFPVLYKTIYYAFLPITIINLFTLMATSIAPEDFFSPSSITMISPDFMQKLIILGIIGVILTFFTNLFSKKTKIHHVLAVNYALFIFLYVFQLFNGFNHDGLFGNYSINDETVQALIGLQIIIIFLLIITVIRGIYHLIKILEIIRFENHLRPEIKKNFLSPKLATIKKNKFASTKLKLSNFVKMTSLCILIFLSIYVSTLIGSGFNVKLEIPETYSLSLGSDEIDHEGFCANVDFDIQNMGIYPITDIYIAAEAFTKSSSDINILPIGVKVANLQRRHLEDINALTPMNPNSVASEIVSDYLIGFLLCDCVLEIKLSGTSKYGGISIAFDFVMEWNWKNLLETIHDYVEQGDIDILIQMIEDIGIENLLKFVSLEYILNMIDQYGISLILNVLSLREFLMLFGLNDVMELLTIIDVSDLLFERDLI